jgi:hypothetical protein
MRWLLTLYAFIIFFNVASAQSLNETKGSLGIHIVPLSLFDFNPRLRLGLEYRGFNRLGYNIELGWGNHLFKDLSITESVWSDHYSFFEIRPEIKRYSYESERMEKYLGAELFYSYLSDQIQLNDYYQQNTGDNIYFEKASFQRHKIGMMLKAGFKWLVGNRFTIDYSSGFGLAYRSISYTDQVNPQIIDRDFEHAEFFTPSRKKEGEYIIGQISLHLKFGYLLNQ